MIITITNLQPSSLGAFHHLLLVPVVSFELSYITSCLPPCLYSLHHQLLYYHWLLVCLSLWLKNRSEDGRIKTLHTGIHVDIHVHVHVHAHNYMHGLHNEVRMHTIVHLGPLPVNSRHLLTHLVVVPLQLWSPP